MIAGKIVPLKGVTPCYRTTLRVAMDVLLDRDLLPAHAADARRWNDRVVAMTALLMGFDDAAAAATDRFAAAREAVVEMFPSRRRPGTSYNGFIKALRRFSDARLADVHGHLRTRMAGLLGKQWATLDGRGGRWVILAVDGTRASTRRTRRPTRRASARPGAPRAARRCS